MQSYIITFQTSLQDKSSIEQSIKTHRAWASLHDTAWAVLTNRKAKEIRDLILPKLASGDRLLVVRSGTEAAWSNLVASSDWLKKNL